MARRSQLEERLQAILDTDLPEQSWSRNNLGREPTHPWHDGPICRDASTRSHKRDERARQRQMP